MADLKTQNNLLSLRGLKQVVYSSSKMTVDDNKAWNGDDP
jgi:hypothetical protein